MHGVYIPHPHPCMGTAWVKEEVGTDTQIIVKEYSMKYGRKERGHEGENVPNKT